MRFASSMSTESERNAMAAEENDLDRYVNLFGYNPRYGISGKPIGSITYCAQSYDPHPPLYMLSE